MPLDQFSERVPFLLTFQFTDVTGDGSWQSMNTGNTDVQRVDVMQASNSDTIDHDLWLDVYGSEAASVFGSVTIPAGAGYGAVPPVDLFAALLPAADHFVILVNGNVPVGRVVPNINTGKDVTVTIYGGSF
jgi:hypothetical protein